MDEHWLKKLTTKEMLEPGSRIVLILASKKSPVKFRTEVGFLQDQVLGLNLPGAWWKLAEFLPGMAVRLYKSLPEGVFYAKGTILEIHQPSPPHLIIECSREINRDQRRLFFRLAAEREFHFNAIVLPEGIGVESCPFQLTDISAGGIGFNLPIFLPPGTRMESEDLLLILEPEGCFPCCLEVVWCRTFRPRGYRLGARFLHADTQAQDRIARIIHQLQWRRIARKNAGLPLD
jgi:hypothetical protein